jgi:hypothetical protein
MTDQHNTSAGFAGLVQLWITQMRDHRGTDEHGRAE